MADYDFEYYGFSTKDKPVLQTSWNEQKRVVDLSHKSYVFITSLYSSPWRLRERFPNADKCTLFYYWSKYGDRRIKRSLNWMSGTAKRINAVGATKSKVFGEKW